MEKHTHLIWNFILAILSFFVIIYHMNESTEILDRWYMIFLLVFFGLMGTLQFAIGIAKLFLKK